MTVHHGHYAPKKRRFDPDEATLAMLTPAERMATRNRVALFATYDSRAFGILDRLCDCEGVCECESRQT